MNICIDMRPALSRPTGVGVYLQNLVSALAQIDSENQYHLFSSSWKERFVSKSYPSNFTIHDKKLPVRLLNYCWNRLAFPPVEVFINQALQVVHSPTPLLIPTRKARSITTVHDLFFFTNPHETVREMQRDFPRLLKKHCMQSDAIITVSEHTKKQLMDLVGIPSSRIYTIRHGVDPYFNDRANEAEIIAITKHFQILRPYVLFVGTREPRKNLKVLLEAMGAFSEDLQLVIAGPEGWGNEGLELSADVIQTNYVSKQDLRALYQKAVTVVYPSLEEGFGLPLLEAMASGVPVIASRIPAFLEVCNNSCLYFDATNPEELAAQIRRVNEDTSLRDSMICKGKERVKKFSWIESATKTLELYRSL